MRWQVRKDYKGIWRLFLIFGSFYQEKEQDNYKPTTTPNINKTNKIRLFEVFKKSFRTLLYGISYTDAECICKLTNTFLSSITATKQFCPCKLVKLQYNKVSLYTYF